MFARVTHGCAFRAFSKVGKVARNLLVHHERAYYLDELEIPTPLLERTGAYAPAAVGGSRGGSPSSSRSGRGAVD